MIKLRVKKVLPPDNISSMPGISIPEEEYISTMLLYDNVIIRFEKLPNPLPIKLNTHKIVSSSGLFGCCSCGSMNFIGIIVFRLLDYEITRLLDW